MNTPITPQTTVASLVDFWLERLRAEQRLDGTTINQYERVLLKLVIPRLDAVSIGELTTSRIDEVLVELGNVSLNSQRKAKVVTGSMLDAAVELDALTVNPVRGSLSISRPSPDHPGRSQKQNSTPCAQQFTRGSARNAQGRSPRATSPTSSR